MRQGIDHLVHDGIVGTETASKSGKGLFSTREFHKGDVLVVFGGRAITRETLERQRNEEGRHALQIGDGIFLQGSADEEGEWVNHSCDPNLGFEGQITLVAMRDIATGEEVCFDYAMTDTNDTDEFDCACGGAHCRGRVTGEDWRLPELQRRYAGYFAAHVQRAIDDMANEKASR
jgi:hypothetical protein